MTKTYPDTKYEYYNPETECCHPLHMVEKVKIIYEQDKGDAANSYTIAKLYKDSEEFYGIR